MGKIFNYEDIKNHRVPTRDDFMEARSLALISLGELARSGGIYGAKAFGSVANGTPSERSDFDLLIVTERDDAIHELKSIFEAIHANTKVGIEPIVIARNFAERGFHSVDLFFLQHIQALPNEGNLAGYDPMEVMKPIDLPMTKIHEQYLTQKVRRLREGIFAYSETDKCRVLQRALEAPINVGRRIMQVLAEIGYPTEITDDRKPAVAKVFRETFAGTNLVSGFDSLFAQDGQYTDCLRATMKGTVSKDEYESTVQDLAKEAIPKALKWTSDLSTIYLNLLEGNSYHHGSKERL